MPVTRAGMNRIFQDWIRGGLSLSLHTRRPTASGRPYLVKKSKVPSGYVKVQNDRLQNLQQINLGVAEFSGSAKWIGVWTGNTLLFSSRINKIVNVTENSEVIIPVRAFNVRIK